VFSHLLVEFLFRLTFGIAAAMAVTSSRQVTSGFFRVHLWVLMGLQTLAALAAYAASPRATTTVWIQNGQCWLAVAAAVLSYVGAVIWLYDRAVLGKTIIVAIAACSVAGIALPLSIRAAPEGAWHLAGNLTSGLLLGAVTTAMLLGHWYLNTPTMQIAPLRRLLMLLAVVVVARALVCGAGLGLEIGMHPQAPLASWSRWMVFVALRWLAGLVGVGFLAGLTWQTLKIPNTQSATGILYAAVVLAFIGELMSQILSSATHYPV
jgi:hypothetical protein